ncbi:MAG: hypothetical protein PHI59_02260 [Candidatus Omnitrophica bacterium]|nr:hypothetical protein [Candidatus Omnitrophota bacterium]
MFSFKNCIKLALFFIFVMSMYGCAEINPFEAPEEVMRHPLGTESIKTGMSKEEVTKEWGKPDIINALGVQDATGSQQEVWIYKARQYAGIPVDAGYLSKNKYLYFDGNNLTLIANEPK